MTACVDADEGGIVTPAMWDYLVERWRRPMCVATVFRLQLADAAARLEAFEQQLQRRRILAEHDAAVLARRLANWDAIEALSPYRSWEVH